MVLFSFLSTFIARGRQRAEVEITHVRCCDQAERKKKWWGSSIQRIQKGKNYDHRSRDPFEEGRMQWKEGRRRKGGR